MSDDIASEQVKFRKNGDLTITEDGTPTVIAHYDAKSGHLEFVTKDHSAKFYNQVTTRICTVAQGTQPSGLVIRTFGIKGGPPNKIDPKAPKRPRLGAEGDAAEEFVAWMLEWDLPQAIIRYGIYTDENGAPICKHVRRVIQNTIDARNIDDDDIPEVKEGPKTKSKAPVSRQSELIEQKDGVIARRATALTFTPAEVVGGWQPDDNYEPMVASEEEST